MRVTRTSQKLTQIQLSMNSLKRRIEKRWGSYSKWLLRRENERSPKTFRTTKNTKRRCRNLGTILRRLNNWLKKRTLCLMKSTNNWWSWWSKKLGIILMKLKMKKSTRQLGLNGSKINSKNERRKTDSLTLPRRLRPDSKSSILNLPWSLRGWREAIILNL